MKTALKLVPELRFPRFEGNYHLLKIKHILNRSTNPVSVDNDKLYQQIGIRSHGKGIFHKTFVSGKDLGNKRVFWVKENVFIVNIVFAWEQAVAITSRNEIGMIASHRFPMYKPIEKVTDIQYILYFFLRPKGKHLLGLASPGGAGRNKTLGQKSFEELKMPIPSLPEQQKIAAFLSGVDKKIENLSTKKELLQTYKKGVMQKIFSREIRFKDDDGKDFPDWEEKRLGEVFTRLLKKNNGNSKNVLTASARFGLINQEQFFNKSVSSIDLSNYYLMNKGDFAYNKSYCKGYPMGAVKRLNKYESGVVSPLYICFKITGHNDSDFYEKYFEHGCLNRGLHKIAQEGARNHGLLNVSVIEFFKDIDVLKPCFKEQNKIASFLSNIDKKIEAVDNQLTKMQTFKKGLLQKMFV